MPRVTFVKKAQKDQPQCGVKRGESYFWWKFRFGGKRCGKTRPLASQLTQSDFWQQAYGIQEDMAASSFDNADDLKAAVDDWSRQIRDLGQECLDKKDNMPYGLQESDTGYLLDERANACEAWADEIEGIELPDPNDYPTEDDEADFEQAMEDALTEIQNVELGCS